jgi:Helix-turn-helix
MPQPIDRIVPDPHVYLKTDILQDKPEFAILVAEIFSVWARIEQELSLLLIRVLGANAAPVDANVDRSYVGRLERGLENPTVGILERLASALSAHISELFVLPKRGDPWPMPLRGGRRAKPISRRRKVGPR